MTNSPEVHCPRWAAVGLGILFLSVIVLMGRQAYWHLTDPVVFDAYYRPVVINGKTYRPSEVRCVYSVCEPKK